MEKAFRTALKHPGVICVLSLWLVLVCGVGLKNFAVTADYRVFFSAENPQLKAFEAQERLFYKSDTVVFGLDTGTPNGLFTLEAIQAIDWLSQQAGKIPYKQRIDSLTRYRFTSSPTPDDLITDALVPNADQLTTADIELLFTRANSEPNIKGRLFSEDGRAALVIVTVELPGENRRQEIPEVTLKAREIEQRFAKQWPQFDSHLFGMVPFNQSLSETTLRDLGTLFPISVAAMLLLLAFLLRGIRPMVITSAIILASVVVGVGIAGWSGLVFNTATAAAPIIILTLSIAHSVHLFTNFQQALATAPTPEEALAHSLRVNWLPVSLTCITTIMGFLSLNASDAPPFRELGNVVAVGIAASWWFSLFLLPALVQLLGAGRYRSPSTAWVSGIGHWVIRRRWVLLILMPTLFAPLLYLVQYNQLNDVIREWFGEDNPVRQGMEFSLAHMGGVESLHFTLDSGQANGVVQPDFIRDVEAFTHWLSLQKSTVTHVNSYTRLLKRMNQATHNDEPDWYHLPDNYSLARSYLSLAEMGQGDERSLNAMLDLDKRRARITATLGRVTSNDIKGLATDSLMWLENHTHSIQQAEASGTSMMFAELGFRNIRSMLEGTLWALIGISLTLVITFRSIKIGLLSLVPNLIPAGLGFGLWAVLDGSINIALATVMGMTLGIVVDDTIHFLSKYLRGRREQQLNAAGAVQYAFDGVGQALWVTTLVLVGGFLILSGSDFTPMSDIGILTALVIGFALIADFLLLPSLLMLIDRNK